MQSTFLKVSFQSGSPGCLEEEVACTSYLGVNNLFGLNGFPGCFGFVKCIEIGQSQQGVDDGGRTYEESPGKHY